MPKQMPTPNELRAMIANADKYPSIRYGDSRTILRYMNKPVVAYGFGFNGFVCIIKLKYGRLKGYVFGARFPLHNYTESVFSEIDYEYVLDALKTSALFKKKGIDTQIFTKYKIKDDYKGNWPIVAYFKQRQAYKYDDGSLSDYDTRIYKLVRLRNGKLIAQSKSDYSKTFSSSSLYVFIDAFECPIGLHKKDNTTYDTINEDVNVPSEILREVQDQLLVRDI